MHALTRSLKQSKLHEYLLAKAKVDVDRAGMALLYVLFVEGASLRVTDLAEQLQIEPPAVTRKAQDLERAGLVVRAPDRNDARATRLQLTAAGRRTINRILVVRREWLAALFSDWPVASRTEFARLLGLLSERVNEHVKGLDTHQPSA
ncbi:MAG: MarR family winged helix-turn-helix transcriptional regulator [Acidimicrobiales bacterium]